MEKMERAPVGSDFLRPVAWARVQPLEPVSTVHRAPGRHIFVGRSAELARLRSELDWVRAGRPRLVWLEGEVGMGKTALLRRFLAAAQGMDVLWATGDRREAGLRFGLLDLLGFGGEVPAAHTEPLRAGEALWGGLQRRAAERPVAVVIDDMHWADAASSVALLFAARHLRDAPVLWLLASRPDVPVAELDGWRGQFGDPGFGMRMVLGGLEAGELLALAAGLSSVRLTPRAAQRLRDLCAGNPGYAAAILEDGLADSLNDPAAPPPVPARLVAEVEGRLAPLAPDVVHFIQAAAVLGEDATRDRAASVAGGVDPLTALSSAQAAGLLRAGGHAPGGSLAFSVRLLGAAVLRTLSPVQLRELHRRAAAELTWLPALRHRAASAVGPDPALAAALGDAACVHGDGGADMAVLLMRAAADLSPEYAPRERRLMLATLLMLRAGDTEGAELTRPAVRSCHPGPLRDLVLGALDLQHGRLGPAEDALARSLAGGRRTADNPVVAGAAACLVRLRAAQGRPAEVPALAEVALAASAELPAVRIHVAATWLWCLGGLRPGAADFERVRELLRRHAPGRGEPEEHLLQGLAAASRHDPAAAAEDLGLALQGAGPHAPGRPEVIELWRADAEFAAGLWDDAERHAREVAALAPADDPLGAAAPAHALLARLHAARAAWWQAEGHLRLAAERRVPSTGRAWLDLALAELAWLQGRPQEALAALGEAREADASGEALVLRADVLLRLGGPAEADAAVARVEALAAQATPSSWLALAAARLRGELEAAQENEGAALAVLTTGMLRRQTHPLASAHLEEAYGRLLRRVGRPGAAAAALQAARERLAQVGATAYLAGVERELRACGVPPSGWALERPKLSPREHEVALLAAAGYTNRDIAQRLHLSVKAVEYHITRVLAKLGAGSRRELPGLLPRARTPAGGGLPSLLQREE